MNVDVIVAGAGPTGLLLAHELQLAGVGTYVIDRLDRRGGQSKALNLQPRSAEILDLRGLLRPLLDQAADRIPAGHFAGIPLDYTVFDTRFPYQIGIPQAKVEAALERHVIVHYGQALTALAQDDAGVTVHIGQEVVRARYVVGCDGGRSTVRKLLGTPFIGRDPRMCALVADITLDGADLSTGWHLPDLTPRDGGVVTLLPLGGGLFRLLAAGPEQQTIGRDAPVTTDELQRILDGRGLRLGEVRWASRFTDASRQAERYRTGRVLLAGDAAHIHTPTGGQGLNLGLQDAFNLGWKLAATVNGWAPPDLLDTYHAERHPVAAQVLANTRAQGVLMVPDDDVLALRGVFSDLAAFPDVNRHLAGLVSGLSLGPFLPDPALAPLLHTGRGLLVHPNPAELDLAAWADRVTVTTGDTPMLVRPDGYVAWTPGDAPIESALTTWFGSRTESVRVS